MSRTDPHPTGDAADLAVLFPDVDLTVRDPDTGAPVALTVREFRFREGLEAGALARPLIDALAHLVPDSTHSAMPGPGAIDEALSAWPDLWLELIARACDRDAAWLARLGDADAHALSMAMWTANGPFFLRRIAATVVGAAATETLFRSLASSRTSPAPDTDPTSPSA